MSYDENIIKLKNAYKTETIGTVEEGIYIKEELYEFEKRSILDGRITAYIPKQFVDMPLDLAKIKYPSEQRPKVIYMDSTTTINFGFQSLEVPSVAEQAEEIRDTLRTVCQKTFPANVFYDKGTFELGDTKLSWFDYKSHTVDGPMYNVMYAIPAGQILLHGMFNCAFECMDNWKPVIMQVMEKMEVQPGGVS